MEQENDLSMLSINGNVKIKSIEVSYSHVAEIVSDI